MSAVGLYADEILADLPADECDRLYRAIRYRWPMWARPKQLPPVGDDWDILGLVAGRGGGKTRPGAEWVRQLAKDNPGARMALVARSSADARDTLVQGESGILAVSPPWFRPRYYPSKRMVVWPNGFEAHLYTDAEPDLLRGPQHHFAWGDELAAWRHKETLSNLQDGLRLGTRPKALFTTTPRRTPMFLDLFCGQKDQVKGSRPVTAEHIASGAWEFSTKVTDHFGREVVMRTIVRRWRTEENAVNLASGFAAKRRAIYGDSSYGRMELDAAILEVVEGALWMLVDIDRYRVQTCPQHVKRVVSVDPSTAEDGGGDACGIVVLGAGPAPDGRKSPLDGYVLADRSMNGSPNKWGKAAIQAYDDFRADLIVYEGNETPGKPNVVRDTIKSVDPQGRVKWHPIYASRDKRARAEPVASLYEMGRVHHLEDPEKPNQLAALEDEMVSWDSWDPTAKSPNRLDAVVHGVTYLLLGKQDSEIVVPVSVGTRANPFGGM